MLTIAQVLKSMEELPKEMEVSFDDLVERFMFIFDLENRIKESDNGQVTDHETVKKQLLEEDWDEENTDNEG